MLALTGCDVRETKPSSTVVDLYLGCKSRNYQNLEKRYEQSLLKRSAFPSMNHTFMEFHEKRLKSC